MGKKIGLAGGFSARYGTVTRRQYVEIVTGLRGKHECPRCMFRTVKRWSVGVWHCRKCGYKFAGGAYTPRTKLGEIAARATRGLMSPSTLSTELDSLRAGAKVAVTVVPTIKKTRTRRKKVATPEAEKKSEEGPVEDPQPAPIADAEASDQPVENAGLAEQMAAVGVVRDAVRHSLSVCAKAFDILRRWHHPRP